MQPNEERQKDQSSRRFMEIELRLSNLERKVDENIMMTSGVFEIVDTGKSFFKVLGLIGNIVKWAGGVAVAIGAVWAVFVGKNGG